MLTWINAGCDVGLGLPKCQAMHPTSVLGQKQTCAARKSMSVLCPMADMANTIQQICSGSGPIDYSLVSFIIVVSSPLRSAVNDTLSPGFMALKTSPSWTLK